MPEVLEDNPLQVFLRRRWWLLALFAGVAAVGAALAAQKFAAQSYTTVATLLYNRSSLGAPHYQQPDVQSIQALVKSQPVLAAVAKGMDPPPSLKSIADSVQVEIVASSTTLQLTMRGGDPKQNETMLNRLIAAIVAQAGSLRKHTVDQIYASQRDQAAVLKAEADAAAAALTRFNAEHGIIISVDDDLERIHDDIATIETALETERPAEFNPEEVLQRQKALLQEQLSRDRDEMSRSAQLDLKKNEFDRAHRLHAKQYISDAEFRRIEAEFRVLQSQDSEALRVRKTRIAELEKSLAEQMHNTPGAAATIGHAPSTAASTAAVAAAPPIAPRTRAYLEQRRSEAERLNGLRKQAAELQRAVTIGYAEAQRSAVAAAGYQELAAAPYLDLIVVQPAAPSLDPVSSNKKKLFSATFVCLFIGLVAPVLVFDFALTRKKKRSRSTVLATVPSIAPVSLEKPDHAELVRTTALRIQQTATDSSNVVMLARVDREEPPLAFAMDLAECLGRRNEKVLLIETTLDPEVRPRLLSGLAERKTGGDAVFFEWMRRSAPVPESLERTPAVRAGTPTTAASPTAGLTDLLASDDMSPAEVVRRAALFDCLLAGDSSLPLEAFAGRRMSELLMECRQRYSTILLLSPSIDRSVDLELLAARVNSVLLVSGNDGVISKVAERSLENLIMLHAPMLGVVTV
jgi:capsular polysaccharide biosynthesis protein